MLSNIGNPFKQHAMREDKVSCFYFWRRTPDEYFEYLQSPIAYEQGMNRMMVEGDHAGGGCSGRDSGTDS